MTFLYGTAGRRTRASSPELSVGSCRSAVVGRQSTDDRQAPRLGIGTRASSPDRLTCKGCGEVEVDEEDYRRQFGKLFRHVVLLRQFRRAISRIKMPRSRLDTGSAVIGWVSSGQVVVVGWADENGDWLRNTLYLCERRHY